MLAGDARALPVFARRYQTACSTCHVVFPKLNPFGEAFRRNGYQFPDGGDEEAIKQAQLTLVTDANRQVFPRAFWPSDIPNYLPMAFVGELLVPIFPDSSVRPVGENAISFDRLFARADLLLSARLGRDVAVFTGISFDSVAGFNFNRGFLVFSNLFGRSALNLRVGQFEPQIFSFSDYRRAGGPGYLILSSTILHSQWNFELARGFNFSGTIRGRFGWDAAFVQGVEGSYGTESIQQWPRDGYLHAYTKIGGLRLDGIEPADGALPPFSGERSVLLGAFFYAGQHDVDVDNDRTKPAQTDVLFKAGGDLDALIGRFELLAAAAYEQHRFAVAGKVTRTQTLIELTGTVLPWFLVVARGELEFAQGDVGVRVTPLLIFHPRINLKLQLWTQLEKVVGRDDFHFTEIDIGGKYAF